MGNVSREKIRRFRLWGEKHTYSTWRLFPLSWMCFVKKPINKACIAYILHYQSRSPTESNKSNELCNLACIISDIILYIAIFELKLWCPIYPSDIELTWVKKLQITRKRYLIYHGNISRRSRRSEANFRLKDVASLCNKFLLLNAIVQSRW